MAEEGAQYRALAAEDQKANRKQTRRVNLAATYLSAGIFFFAVGLFLGFRSIGETMAPNEWGDFFAGFAGSLALIWLIASFLLQRLELEQNTRMLHLQAEELSENTAALEVQAEQLKVAAEEAKRSNEISTWVELLKITDGHLRDFPRITPKISRNPMGEYIIRFSEAFKPSNVTYFATSNNKDAFIYFPSDRVRSLDSWYFNIREEIHGRKSVFIDITLENDIGIRLGVKYLVVLQGQGGIQVIVCNDGVEEIAELHAGILYDISEANHINRSRRDGTNSGKTRVTTRSFDEHGERNPITIESEQVNSPPVK
ncbi:hypothetical protein [Sneathiella sp.]|uniref:hypothetical protein n=1 Tax=Sneathiella sp. TaxID=1964365 RepID=UPI002FE35CEB